MPRDFVTAFGILQHAISARAFPGAAVGIVSQGGVITSCGMGRYTYDIDAPMVRDHTVYDLASLTKVVATTAMAMLLLDRGLLNLGSPVADILPQFVAGDPRKRRVTVRMLLAHNSGLPGYVRLFEQVSSAEELLQQALEMPLAHDPLTHAEYSDIGFIVLGAALEMIAGESIAGYCEREIFRPLQMASTRFLPPEEWWPQIPPTEDDQTFRKRVIQGEVHDENASMLGGIAGHAGLFSNAPDIARFAQELLRASRGQRSLFRQATVRMFTRRAGQPEDSSRALGWDTPSQPSQSGHCFSEDSFGHLGFTGTSLWIDPERQLAVALLTNRTWPDRGNQAIKEVRPRFHDAVAENL